MVNYINADKNFIVIIIISFCIEIYFSQNIPFSPCPKYFQYRYDGSRWLGIIQIKNLPVTTVFKVNVYLLLQQRLPTNNLGTLELYKNRKETLINIVKKKIITYKIKFPPFGLVPKINEIYFNGRIICKGIRDIAPIITTIHLEHILYTQAIISKPLYLSNETEQQAIGTTSDDYLFENDFENFDTLSTESFYPNELATTKPDFIKYQEILSISESNCGQVDSKFQKNPLIVGGENFQRGSWPWLVAIYINLSTTLSFQCGGSLISKRAVITSAHCFYISENKYNEKDIIVFLGRHNIRNWSEEGAIAASCKKLITHPNYLYNSSSFDADIAILLLEKIIEYNEYIRPACLWLDSTNSEYKKHKLGVVAGWGRGDKPRQILTSEPKKINVKIVSNTVCIRSNKHFKILMSNRTFCAGNRYGHSPCNGDSGGGLLIYFNDRWILRGIVSASLGDSIKNFCRSDEYIIYADVSKFIDWIKPFLAM